MNILHFIFLVLFNSAAFYLLVTNQLNILIHPKFNTIMLCANILVFVLIFITIFFIIRKKIKFEFKIDLTLIILLPILIIFFGNKKFDTTKFIKQKFKGNFNMKNIKEHKKNLGARLHQNKNYITDKKDGYQIKNMLEIYEELETFENKDDIKNYSYKIKVIGKVYDGYSDSLGQIISLYENEYILVRMIMVCCIADMIPVGIVVQNNNNYDYTKIDSWLQVQGTLEFFKTDNGLYIGFLKDEKIKEIKEPDPEWLYPDMQNYPELLEY